MIWVIKWLNLVVSDIDHCIRSSSWSFHIDENIWLFDFGAVDIESIPIIAISTIAPVVARYGITPMDKQIHQYKFLVSALNFNELFLNISNLMKVHLFLLVELFWFREFVVPSGQILSMFSTLIKFSG